MPRPSAPATTPSTPRSHPRTRSSASWWTASCGSPGGSTASIAPWPPARPILIRDPRGPTCFYPQWETTLGKIPRVSWTEELDDPNDPARIVIAMEARALGCAWLLDRWAELRGLLD